MMMILPPLEKDEYNLDVLATFCTSAQQPRIFSTQVLLHPASKLRLAKLLLFFVFFSSSSNYLHCFLYDVSYLHRH